MPARGLLKNDMPNKYFIQSGNKEFVQSAHKQRNRAEPVTNHCHAIQLDYFGYLSGWEGIAKWTRDPLFDMTVTAGSSSADKALVDQAIADSLYYEVSVGAATSNGFFYNGGTVRGGDFAYASTSQRRFATHGWLRRKATYSGGFYVPDGGGGYDLLTFTYEIAEEVSAKSNKVVSKIITTSDGNNYSAILDQDTGLVTRTGDEEAVNNCPSPGFGNVFIPSASSMRDAGGTQRVQVIQDFAGAPPNRVRHTWNAPADYFFPGSASVDYVSQLDYSGYFELEDAIAFGDYIMGTVELGNLAYFYDPPACHMTTTYGYVNYLQWDRYYRIYWSPEDEFPPYTTFENTADGDTIPGWPEVPVLRIIGTMYDVALAQEPRVAREIVESTAGLSPYLDGSVAGIVLAECRVGIQPGTDNLLYSRSQYLPLERTGPGIVVDDGHAAAYELFDAPYTEPAVNDCVLNYLAPGDHILRTGDLVFTFGEAHIHRENYQGLVNPDPPTYGCKENPYWASILATPPCS